MARRPAKAAAPADPPPRDWDAMEGVFSPRECAGTLGQETPRGAFEEAWNGGRRHHAWLLRGPRGVGKASFAHQAARMALCEGLEPEEAARAEAQLKAGAHPGLFELRRGYNEKTKKFRTEIAVDDVRRLIDFFQLSSADGGWRVALIDPADELNRSSANALLKLLEEPPTRSLFFLIAHAPGGLAPTLRSRCRRLDFHLLTQADSVASMRAAAPDLTGEEAEALSLLAEGSPGEGLRLRAAGGLELYAKIIAFLQAPAEPARQRPLIDAAASRGQAAPGLAMLARLLPLALARLARAPYRPAGLLPPEQTAAAQLCSGDAAARLWAEAAGVARDKLEAAAGLHLDPSRAILDTALYLEQTARRARAL